MEHESTCLTVYVPNSTHLTVLGNKWKRKCPSPTSLDIVSDNKFGTVSGPDYNDQEGFFNKASSGATEVDTKIRKKIRHQKRESNNRKESGIIGIGSPSLDNKRKVKRGRNPKKNGMKRIEKCVLPSP